MTQVTLGRTGLIVNKNGFGVFPGGALCALGCVPYGGHGLYG